VTSVVKAGGRSTKKLTTLQQPASSNSQGAPKRVAQEPEPDEAGAAAGMVDPLKAGFLDPLAAGILDPLKAGFLDPLAAGILDPLKAGFLDPLAAGMLDPLKAGFLDPLVAGILVCAEANVRVERMNAVKIIVVLEVVVIDKLWSTESMVRNYQGFWFLGSNTFRVKRG
jgi:mannose/fructose/N-acetylgalactosamine-specific phosphotransferase system component IID